MTLTEKVAFLKGLIEGSELKLDKKEEKIFEMMVELLDDLANAVTDIDEDVSVLYDDVDDLADAVDELDETIYYLSDDMGYDDDLFDDDFMYEIECDKCRNVIVVDEDVLLSDDEISCPSCGEPIELVFDCDCEDCDCDDEGDDCCCGHDHK